MFNNAQSDQTGLSRSVSQNDHSGQLLSYSKDQSSCSSLTSGIGQSDQSICNDRTSALEQEEICSSGQQQQPNIRPPPGDETKSSPLQPQTQSQTQPQATVTEGNKPIDFKKTSSVSQYLRSPPVSKPDQVVAMANCESPSSFPEGLEERLRNDIKQFVDVIFTDSQSISLERKAEFGKLMRTPEARLLFAIFVDDYRVNSKRVSELTFYSLAQYFSIVLLECLLAEDFRPAKIIMNMMFTYYYEQTLDKIPAGERSLVLSQDHMANKSVITYDDDGPADEQAINCANSKLSNGDMKPKTVKTFLYTLLKDQEIFKSIRFWTSAFYESVIIERNNHSVFVDKQRGRLSNEKRDEELDCSKNITFGLLGSFIHNMCLLDLSHEFCREFLNKHSTIAGLSDNQLDMLRSNLEAMFSETSSDKAPISSSERLSKFLQKLGTRLNQTNA